MTRAKQGMYLGSKAPYGYVKDPADKHHLLVDEENRRNRPPYLRHGVERSRVQQNCPHAAQQGIPIHTPMRWSGTRTI